jgi:hypothetical protein
MKKSIQAVTDGTTHADRQWNNLALAGSGGSLPQIKSIMGNVSVLYNFLHDGESPYHVLWCSGLLAKF